MTKDPKEFLAWMGKIIWELGDPDQEAVLLGYLRDLGFDNEADTIAREIKEADLKAYEDFQDKQDYLQH